MAGNKSVPKSIHKIVIVPRGSGMANKMNIRNGEISGMLLVSVYAIDFFKLSKIKRPERVMQCLKIETLQKHLYTYINKIFTKAIKREMESGILLAARSQ